MVNTLIFMLILCGLNAVMWAFGWFPITFLWLWLGVAGVGALYLFVGLVVAGADKMLYKSLFYIPAYALGRVKFYAKDFLTKNDKELIRRPPRETPPVIEKTRETK